MHHHSSRIACSLVSLTLTLTLTLTVFSTVASAQSAEIGRATCQVVGTGSQEPIGDREGHALSMNTYSCHIDDGSLAGAIMTGTNIREFDKGVFSAISENGVIRKPGAFVVYQVLEDKVTLTMVDGKMTGFTGVARGIYKFASGSFAPFSGKSYSATYRSIGGGQFAIETKLE